MIDVLKESFDVCFYDVAVVAKVKLSAQVLDCCMGTEFRTVSITAWTKILFIDGFQYFCSSTLGLFCLLWPVSPVVLFFLPLWVYLLFLPVLPLPFFDPNRIIRGVFLCPKIGKQNKNLPFGYRRII